MFQRLKLHVQLNFALSSGHDNFVEYRMNARDSNLSGRIQANLLMVRLNALKFFKEQDQKSVSEFEERFNLLNKFIGQGKKLISR
ncbi:hypothetical protein CWB72_12810 [Pseudoalteromonas phenolica]|uniref:hypothetical protein n=1 Tax=Pseudoalteromonas phenolica TaxID=161398 RepID=UPI00110AD4B4|nr:hypothetical protein [Pseudoalteromonas phenolica]TMN88618.1 hypothetical protein CWB72_12810 [Pseudoalteromonas phenolica]